MIQTQDFATLIDKIIHPTESKLSLFNKKNLGYLFCKKLNQTNLLFNLLSFNFFQVLKNSTFILFVNGQHITTQRL